MKEAFMSKGSTNIENIKQTPVAYMSKGAEEKDVTDKKITKELSYNELKEIAKDNGIPFVGKSKDKLIEEIAIKTQCSDTQNSVTQ
jgi:hypothetical protein